MLPLQQLKLSRKIPMNNCGKHFKTASKNTLFAVPILLYVIYKYINYDIPDGFWSTLFSWIPIYWLILFTLGIPYLVVIADCYGVFSRKNEEWQELFIQQYTSFKWSDLLK